MGFSTTLYRISEDFFRKLELGVIKPNQIVSHAKEFATFEDSKDALVFILKKRTGAEEYSIEEIFFPRESKGSVSDEEFQQLVDSFNYKEMERITSSTFYFLSPDKVAALNAFLSTFDDSELKRLYDAEMLNSNNIYPSLWTRDEDPGNAYNLYHLRNDLKALKVIYEHANSEKDYILAFSG